MAKNSVAGKLIGVRIGGVWIKCQTDATFNITTNVTEEDPCKPDGDSPTAPTISWVERTADTQDWTVDFSSRFLKDTLDTANNAQNVLKLLLDGNVYVEDFEFATASNQNESNSDMVISGSGIITSFALNAPEAGPATFDTTISGNGKPTYTFVPVTT